MNGKIYCITCLFNNKKYIGQTSGQLKKRIYRHKKDSQSKIKQAIHHAIAKYGFDNFNIELVESNITSKEMLNKREKYWIKELNTLAPNGYNLTTGGKVFKISEETRKKRTGPNNHFYGKKHSKESRQKMSLSHKGQKPWNKGKRGLQKAWNKGIAHSKETKKLLSEKALDQFKTKGHPRNGLKHSQETKAQISQSKAGKPGWKWTKEYREKVAKKKQNLVYKAVKLTRDDVNQIRQKYASGLFSQVYLAKEYEVHRKTIGRIVNYKMWL